MRSILIHWYQIWTAPLQSESIFYLINIDQSRFLWFDQYLFCYSPIPLTTRPKYRNSGTWSIMYPMCNDILEPLAINSVRTCRHPGGVSRGQAVVNENNDDWETTRRTHLCWINHWSTVFLIFFIFYFFYFLFFYFFIFLLFFTGHNELH